MAGDTVLVSRDAGFAALERDTGQGPVAVTRTTETPGPVALVGPAASGPGRGRLDGGWRSGRARQPTPVQARWSVRLSQTPRGHDRGRPGLGHDRDRLDGRRGRLDAAGHRRGDRRRPVGAEGRVMTGSPVIWNGVVAVGSREQPGRQRRRARSPWPTGPPRWTTRVAAPFRARRRAARRRRRTSFVGRPDRRRHRGSSWTTASRRWATEHQGALVHAHPIRVDDAHRRGQRERRGRHRWTGRRARSGPGADPTGLPVGLIATPPARRGRARRLRATRTAIQAVRQDRLAASGPESAG